MSFTTIVLLYGLSIAITGGTAGALSKHTIRKEDLLGMMIFAPIAMWFSIGFLVAEYGDDVAVLRRRKHAYELELLEKKHTHALALLRLEQQMDLEAHKDSATGMARLTSGKD